MKLFYSYMGRSRSFLFRQWKEIKSKINKIFLPATHGYFALVMPGRHFFLVFCFTVFCLNGARPQSPEKSGAVSGSWITPLKIGDQIPHELWNLPLQVVNHPEGKETITLSDYKGKLIILDFWATWCAPCIKAFPELQKLSQEFTDELQIILVTNEGKGKINDFLTTQETSLASIVEDNTLKDVFPRNMVPHEVWIKEGKVFAITGSYHVNHKTIKQVLNGDVTSLTEKKVNRAYNLNDPLLIDGNGGDKNDLSYHSIITSYLDGIGGGGTYTDSLGRFKIRGLNATAFQLYSFAARRIDHTLTKNRIIDNTSIKTKLSNVNSANEVDRQHFFCYELIVPKSMAAKAPYMMIEDLNSFFGNKYSIHADYKTVVTKCWVLRKVKQHFPAKTKGGTAGVTKANGIMQMTNQPFTDYFFSLARVYENQSYPFVDRTNIHENVDMQILYDTGDIESMNELLKDYGLTLTLEDCEIDVLELTDINTDTN
ncbi:TlpA family protein disulfide reductase [Sphingobacterium mizutaii]|uniref:TlpA family protein disulfide reductase n=1 Tax=Sphingobacterium mizutaii TaxID=1010 RepID=UPI0016235BC8|nr:TlpA disulfide reductase family protein [Sphingobacterium mizutaii]